MRTVATLLLILALPLTLRAVYFTGGPVRDVGKEDIYPDLESNEKQLVNLFGRILLKQTEIKRSLTQIMGAFGKAESVALPGSADPDAISRNLQLTAQLLALKKELPSTDAGVQVLLRNLKHYSVLQTFQERLDELSQRSQRPLSFVERMALQNDLKMLNSTIFVAQSVNNADESARAAAGEDRKRELRESEAARESIRDSIGK
jgi:hypothetical protein